MLTVALILSSVSLVAGYAAGAGTCTIPDTLASFTNMAERGRDGTNSVTVSPTTQAAGGKVTITVSATGGPIAGILAAAYAGANVVGTHALLTGKTKTCTAETVAAESVITHSAKGTDMMLSWEYTLPATATGTIKVRAMTLIGATPATQKFALGEAVITVGTAGPTSSGAAGSTAAGPAGSTAATDATTPADAAKCTAAEKDKAPCTACIKIAGCQYETVFNNDIFQAGGKCVPTGTPVTTGKTKVDDPKKCADYCSVRDCASCIDSPANECVWCDTAQATTGKSLGRGSCERTKCTLMSDPIKDKTKCPKDSASSAVLAAVAMIVAIAATML